MRGPNRWWILCAVAVMLAVPACTENDIDEGDQDVVLLLTSFDAPAVTGDPEIGFCQDSPTIPCLNSNNCAFDDVCILTGIGGECTISAWTFTLENKPLSEGASESPFNDVVLNSLTIAYDFPPLGSIEFIRTIGLAGVVIPAAGSGSISFPPISSGDIEADNTAVNLTVTLDARTVAGIKLDTTPSTITLFIGDCLP